MKDKSTRQPTGKRRPKHHHTNPKRGGPGIMLTCERGRESKSHREALDILRHYYYTSMEESGSTTSNDLTCNKKSHIEAEEPTSTSSHNESSPSTSARLSLEDEIALLKKGATADAVLRKDATSKSRNEKDAPFQEYHVECRGIVFIMCTLPTEETTSNDACATEKDVSSKDKEESNMSTNIQSKKRKIHEIVPSSSASWDPIQVVNHVIRDIHNSSTPSSRFIIRMIPIQLTCWASQSEVEETAEKLLLQYLIPPAIDRFNKRDRSNKYQPTTFRIDFRRRNCDHLKRDDMITMMAGLVESLSNEALDNDGKVISSTSSADASESEKVSDESKPTLFAVDLKNAEYTILIEIVNTLVGMSVIQDAQRYQNFNIISLKDNE